MRSATNSTNDLIAKLLHLATDFVGFQSDGASVLRDRRRAVKFEIPNVSKKSETLGNDPLAVYKPSVAKQVDAARAMANFTGWAFTAVNAIASEVANIQFRLYQVAGDDEEEVDPEGHDQRQERKGASARKSRYERKEDQSMAFPSFRSGLRSVQYHSFGMAKAVRLSSD